jgi:hypothetical protein
VRAEPIALSDCPELPVACRLRPLAIQNRRRPRQSEEAVHSVQVTRLTRGGHGFAAGLGRSSHFWKKIPEKMADPVGRGLVRACGSSEPFDAALSKRDSVRGHRQFSCLRLHQPFSNLAAENHSRFHWSIKARPWPDTLVACGPHQSKKRRARQGGLLSAAARC